MYPNLRGKARRSSNKKVRVASHIPLLKMGLEQFSPSHIIEHGMGVGSTPFLHDIEAELYSFENQAQWQVCASCSTPTKCLKHTIQSYSKDAMAALVKSVVPETTMVLVDGEGPERFEALEYSLRGKLRWVVEHDAETFSVIELASRKKLCDETGYIAHQYVGENPESVLYVASDATVELDAKLFVKL